MHRTNAVRKFGQLINKLSELLTKMLCNSNEIARSNFRANCRGLFKSLFQIYLELLTIHLSQSMNPQLQMSHKKISLRMLLASSFPQPISGRIWKINPLKYPIDRLIRAFCLIFIKIFIVHFLISQFSILFFASLSSKIIKF